MELLRPQAGSRGTQGAAKPLAAAPVVVVIDPDRSLGFFPLEASTPVALIVHLVTP